MTQAWVTMATTEIYVHAALVLGHSLNEVKTKMKRHIVISRTIPPPTQKLLGDVFDSVSFLDQIFSDSSVLRTRTDILISYYKMQLWKLEQFSKIVFLDADTLVIRNCDELFAFPELSAAPHPSVRSFFHEGVMVLIPSLKTFEIFENYFNWRLGNNGENLGHSQVYNDFWFKFKQSQNYQIPSLYNRFQGNMNESEIEDVRIIHFTRGQKPWLASSTANVFRKLWDSIYEDLVYPKVKEVLQLRKTMDDMVKMMMVQKKNFEKACMNLAITEDDANSELQERFWEDDDKYTVLRDEVPEETEKPEKTNQEMKKKACIVANIIFQRNLNVHKSKIKPEEYDKHLKFLNNNFRKCVSEYTDVPPREIAKTLNEMTQLYIQKYILNSPTL